MCYHAEFGRSSWNHMGVSRGPKFLGDAGPNPPQDEACLTREKHAPSPCVTMPNMVALGQTVGA